jgi:hypothetical protein
MLKLTAIFLAAYTLYSFWGAYSSQNLSPIVGGLLAIVASVGLFLRRSWSQYFVYAVSTLSVLSWLWAIWMVVQHGWPYLTVAESLISLIPGIVLVFLAVGISVVAQRAFRNAS